MRQVERTLALEDLYLGYQKKALQAGEFVAAVRIPLPAGSAASPGDASPAASRQLVASYKVAKRIDQDISAVCAGLAFELSGDEGMTIGGTTIGGATIGVPTIAAVRIAFGGMAATPQRARHAEDALRGRPWSAAVIEAAVAVLGRDYQPISDMRASGDYRLEAAGNLLRRFFMEHATPGAAAGQAHRVDFGLGFGASDASMSRSAVPGAAR